MAEGKATIGHPFSRVLPSTARHVDEVSGRLAGLVDEWDHPTVEAWEGDGHIPRSVLTDIGQSGLYRGRWAEGREAGLGYAALFAGILARVSGGLALATTLHSESFIGALHGRADNDVLLDVLQRALDGDVVGCLAITEPSGGSDILNVLSRATKVPGGWRLQGEKRYISNGGRASHALLLASTDSGHGHPRASSFVVPLDVDGVRISGFYPKLGTNSCDAAHIKFDIVVSDDHMVGAPGLGAVVASRALELERIAVSAQVLAGANQCLRLASAWARRRQQFGRRLIDHQALKHRLAESVTLIWAGEGLLDSVIDSAMMRRHGLGQLTAALKYFTARNCATVVDDCLQIFGGRGYSANYPLERAWRDVRLARIGGGTDEIMLEIIGSSLDRGDHVAERLLDELAARDVPTSGGR